MTDMAPAPNHPHQPLLLLYPPLTLWPSDTVVTMRQESSQSSVPVPQEFPKPDKRPVGMLAFRMLRRAVGCLRVMLSKIVERCGTVMEVLMSSAVCPARAGKGFALGTLRPAGGAKELGREPADLEWNWDTPLMVLTPDVDTMEGELDLSDWLEWESEDEELPSSPADLPDPAPEPMFLFPTPACHTPAPHSLDSDREQEEEEGSDWSDDDDDDDEWDESEESSEVDSELWESFLCSSDPSNPFRLSSPAEKKGRVPETDGLSTAAPPLIAEGESKRANPPQAGTTAGKQVRFSDEVVVRPLVVWGFASRVARDGSCWLEMARDRDRFRRRVQMASDIISPLLQANHRARVWERHQLSN